MCLIFFAKNIANNITREETYYRVGRAHVMKYVILIVMFFSTFYVISKTYKTHMGYRRTHELTTHVYVYISRTTVSFRDPWSAFGTYGIDFETYGVKFRDLRSDFEVLTRLAAHTRALYRTSLDI